MDDVPFAKPASPAQFQMNHRSDADVFEHTSFIRRDYDSQSMLSSSWRRHLALEGKGSATSGLLALAKHPRSVGCDLRN